MHQVNSALLEQSFQIADEARRRFICTSQRLTLITTVFQGEHYARKKCMSDHGKTYFDTLVLRGVIWVSK